MYVCMYLCGRVLPIKSKEAPLEKGTFLRLQVYKREGILPDEVKRRVRKSVIQLNFDILQGLLLQYFAQMHLQCMAISF